MKRLLFIALVAVLILTGCSSEARQNAAESSYQEGYADGYNDGMFANQGDGYDVGYEDGYSDGYDDGSWVLRTYTGSKISWKATPDSTCFSYVGYDSENSVLAVIFRSNETRTYLYSDFPLADYQKFMAADSLGSYYNANIKSEYPCERIDDTANTFFRP